MQAELGPLLASMAAVAAALFELGPDTGMAGLLPLLWLRVSGHGQHTNFEQVAGLAEGLKLPSSMQAASTVQAGEAPDSRWMERWQWATTFGSLVH